MSTPLPIPASVPRDAAFAPLLGLLRDTLVPPKTVAQRWSIGQSHLSNLRRAQRGLPYVRLPTGPKGKGSIRYRLSDIVAAEIMGTCGTLTTE